MDEVNIEALGIEQIIMEALSNGMINLSNTDKLTICFELRYGKGGYVASSKAGITARTPNQSEMLGGEVTDEEWDSIFAFEEFQGELSPKSDAFKMLDGLTVLRDKTEVKYFDNIIRTKINQLFTRYGLPYRVSSKGDKYDRRYFLGKLY